MKSYLERVEKLKKGCNKNFIVNIEEIGIIEFQCGKWKEIKDNYYKMLWCPLCSDEIIKENQKAIEKLNKIIGDTE